MLKDPLKLRASEIVVQFPFALPVVEEKTEEELARISEKRKEQGRKLQEIAAKARMEKVRNHVTRFPHRTDVRFLQLLQKESDLQYLLTLRESREGSSKRDWIVSSSHHSLYPRLLYTLGHRTSYRRRALTMMSHWTITLRSLKAI